MPYNPGVQFDHRQIGHGIASGGANLADALAKEKQKKELLEQQNAFNQFTFNTLKNAKGPDGKPLLSMEEQQQFLKGNINAQNGIITAGGARLMQALATQKEKEQIALRQQEMMMRAAIASRYGANTPPTVDPNTGLIWNGRQWVKPPGAAAKDDGWSMNRAIARGKLNEKGEFTNDYEGADKGEMAKVMTPDGKTLIVPWSEYEKRTNPQQTSPPAPSAASGAAPVTEDKFIVGKKYKDAKGNVATYMGNGQWQ